MLDITSMNIPQIVKQYSTVLFYHNQKTDRYEAYGAVNSAKSKASFSLKRPELTLIHEEVNVPTPDAEELAAHFNKYNSFAIFLDHARKQQ